MKVKTLPCSIGIFTYVVHRTYYLFAVLLSKCNSCSYCQNICQQCHLIFSFSNESDEAQGASFCGTKECC